MFACLRCGTTEPRRSANQIHCIRCTTEVAALIAQDAARRAPRFAPKDLSGWTR